MFREQLHDDKYVVDNGCGVTLHSCLTISFSIEMYDTALVNYCGSESYVFYDTTVFGSDL